MERFKTSACVDAIITRKIKEKTEILLMERINTGDDDGMYELPGGHLEKNEDIFDAMIRELNEELLINVKREKLKLALIMHHYTGERFNFIFNLNGKNINPQIGEKDKCNSIKWFNINQLPKNITIKMKTIINDFKNKIKYDKI